MDEKNSEKKRYNTQELLSLNMDRLKEYMKRVAKEAANPNGMPVLEVSSSRNKTSTRLGKRPSDCKILTLFKDPFLYVQLVAENEKRPVTQQYSFDRASSLKDAVARMSAATYDLVIASPMEEQVPESESKFGSADLFLLLRGQMRPSDMYFLAKKRWFVMNVVGGSSNPERVEQFHKLRDAYQNTLLLYAFESAADEDAKALAAARKIRVVQHQPKELAPLFRMLDELALSGSL